MSNKHLIALAALAAITASAQTAAPDKVTVNGSDQSAARGATGRHKHARRSPSPSARAKGSEAFTVRSSSSPSSSSGAGSANSPLRAPGDLSFGGGPVVPYAVSHAIYMNPVLPGVPNGNCPAVATCWGDPEGFLRDLATSDFIHINDQYVKSSADNRYTVGPSARIDYSPSPTGSPFSDDDIMAIVHAVAASTGQAGYGHIYHVFLPPGQDVCAAGVGCASTTICAYHGSGDFFDIGHILYTVEPDQLGFGCAIAAGSPNGARADSINNVLSHELFEVITDPDGNAWTNTAQLGLLGQEIGDECEFINAAFVFDVPTFKIGKKLYAVQREYDNAQHTCATKPE